jgi:hypothetical protein
MLFPFNLPPSAQTSSSPSSSSSNTNTTTSNHSSSEFLSHLINQSETLVSRGSQTFSRLRPGQLIIHTLTRPLSETHSMQLATLARLTHERHFNTRLYRREELLVPGGLVHALTTSLASRDLHEVLFEELLTCSYPNNLAPGDSVSAVSFIQGVEEHVSGDIEAVTVRTIGWKNLDLQRQLVNTALPTSLFTTSQIQLRPHQIEELLKKTRPELMKSIVCIADRKLYRQAPRQVPFLL